MCMMIAGSSASNSEILANETNESSEPLRPETGIIEIHYF